MTATLATATTANLATSFTQTAIEMTDCTASVTARRTDGPTWSRESRANRTKTTRVYGAVDTWAKAEDDAMPYAGEWLYTAKEQPRLYAELSEADREVMDAKVAEYQTWKKNTLKVAREGMKPAILELLDATDLVFIPKVEGQAPRFGFSIHAGCSSCPCSPGFVLNGQVRNADNQVVDLYFDAR